MGGKSGRIDQLFGLVFSVVSTDDVEGSLFLLPFFWERLFSPALVTFLVCITRKYRGGGFYFPYWGGSSSLDCWIMYVLS